MLFDKTIHELEFLGEAFPMLTEFEFKTNCKSFSNLQCRVFQHFLKIIQQLVLNSFHLNFKVLPYFCIDFIW